jgi:hypothetical protein
VTCVQDTSQTWYLDSDDDGYGVTGSKKTQCTQPVGYAALPNDCDDADEEINPGAVEVCNVVDDNCDNLVDNNVPSPTIWYFDGDGDGYGASPTAAQCTQPVGYSPSGGDCDDSLASVSPAAAEACNGLDDNCNTVVDEGNPDSGASCTTVYPGVCAAGTTACFQGVLICNQINASGSEVCNGLDDDCDGSADENNVCVCATGQTQSCYTGPAGTLGVGICAAGTQTCTAGVWGACQNQVQPGVENCALAPDEDCNGTAPSCSGSTLWAQKFGGTSSDLAYGIAVDGAGNTYITGYFQGTVNFGAGSVTSAGSYDVFLAKLNSAGAYVWSKTFGGALARHRLRRGGRRLGQRVPLGLVSQHHPEPRREQPPERGLDVVLRRVPRQVRQQWDAPVEQALRRHRARSRLCARDRQGRQRGARRLLLQHLGSQLRRQQLRHRGGATTRTWPSSTRMALTCGRTSGAARRRTMATTWPSARATRSFSLAGTRAAR